MAFKVLIVGGSVTGLALANMLEKMGIDFLVLEAYPKIAPQVGASIGLFPNGLRILDQLGCYEAFRDKADELYHQGYYRQSDGKVIGYQHDLVEMLEKELGYPMVWADRQMLLEVLYKNLKQKTKVLTCKRVVSIDTNGLIAQATTEDGSVYSGNILVGADGIHSKVRSEMWKLAPSGYFPLDEISQVPVSTRCIFAISDRPPQYPGATQQNLFFKGHSYLLVAAPKNRLFWFLFEDLPNTIYGRDIPRYTKEDEIALVEKYGDDKLLDNITVKDLYEKRIKTALVPLQEYVFTKWHYQNIITMGDSAHKVDPVTGQGGNGAIESGAILVNALMRYLNNNPDGPSEHQIEKVLAEVHKHRYDRAQAIVNQGHQLQRLLTQRTLLSRFVTHVLMPVSGTLGVLGQGIAFIVGGQKLENVEMPSRPRALPYDDELPAKPIEVGNRKMLAFTGYLAILGSASIFLQRESLGGGFSLSSATDPSGNASSVPALAFCANMMSLMAVSLLEVNRCGNILVSLALVAIFFISNSLMGPGMIAPLCCILAIFAPPSLFGRSVPLKAAKLVLPIISLCYIIPTAMVLSSPTWYTTLAWRLAPSLCFMVARGATVNYQLFKEQTPEIQASVYKKDRETYQGMLSKSDMPALKLVYISAFLLSAVAHLAQVVTFKNVTDFFSCQDCPSLSALGLEKHDSQMFAFSCLMLTLGAGPWNMRSKGFITTSQSSKATLCILASNVILGPGATVAGMSYWRENVLAGLTRWNN